MVTSSNRKAFVLYLALALSLMINAILVPFAGYWLYTRGGLKRFRLADLKGNRAENSIAVRRELFHAFDCNGSSRRPVVMVGDSLTAGGLWSEWFGPDTINRGISGETSTDTLQRARDIAALHPAKVFLLIGTNDFEALPVSSTVDNVRRIVIEMRAGSPVSEIYIQSLLPPPTRIREAWVLQVNAALKQLAEAYHLRWIDLNKVFSDGEFMERKLSLDGVHLTPAGYDVWRRAVEPYIYRHSASLSGAKPSAYDRETDAS